MRVPIFLLNTLHIDKCNATTTNAISSESPKTYGKSSKIGNFATGNLKKFKQ